jgi:hypothetical protein
VEEEVAVESMLPVQVVSGAEEMVVIAPAMVAAEIRLLVIPGPMGLVEVEEVLPETVLLFLLIPQVLMAEQVALVE